MRDRSQRKNGDTLQMIHHGAWRVTATKQKRTSNDESPAGFENLTRTPRGMFHLSEGVILRITHQNLLLLKYPKKLDCGGQR